MTLTLRALRNRNFALFLAGQIFALIGYWMQQIALGWLVYRLTGSAALLGVLAFAANLPILLLAPLAGLWSDRFNRHRMMVATQVVEMLQAVILAILALTGLVAVWHIIALAVLLGICVAIEVPVRHAYLPELLDHQEDLSNAIALISLTGNSGKLIGPVVAGLVIGWLGEGACFVINAGTYVAVLISFALIRIEPNPGTGRSTSALRGISEGVTYAWNSLPIRFLLTLVTMVAITASPYGTLMPAIVHETFNGDAQKLGYLVGASGMGAICGTLWLASRHSVRGLERYMVAAALTAGISLIAFSQSRVFMASLILMVIAGFGVLVISVAANMILQSIVEPDKRGRVMSLYTSANLGFAPLGSLIAGLLADKMGAMNAVLLGAAVCLGATLIMTRWSAVMHEHIAHLYDRSGSRHRRAPG